MKDFDKPHEEISEFDFDSFANEMDILFGDRFGAKSVINNHIDSNIPKYNEAMFSPALIENEDEIKEANDFGALVDRKYKPSRFIN